MLSVTPPLSCVGTGKEKKKQKQQEWTFLIVCNEEVAHKIANTKRKGGKRKASVFFFPLFFFFKAKRENPISRQ